MTIKYFRYPFGINGDLLAIPDPTQVSGVVSYQSGYPIDYQLVDTDPSSLNIQRNQFNQLMFDTTSAIQQLQQNGFPVFITSAMNGGTPYAYSKNSYVLAADGNVYYSLINANTDTPPTANWQLAGSEVLQYFNFAADTGTANHYLIAPSPAVTAYADGDFILLRPSHANTGACDINVNSLGVIPIKTMTNLNPSSGMIIPTGAYILVYFGGAFVLCNPALGTAAYLNTGTANGNLSPLNIVMTSATNGYEVRGPLTYQWGVGICSNHFGNTSALGLNTFNIPFGGTPYHVGFTVKDPASTPGFTTGSELTPNTSHWSPTQFYAQAPNWGSSVSSQAMSWFAIGPTA